MVHNHIPKSETASGFMSYKCSWSQRKPSILWLCAYHSTFSSGKTCKRNKMYKWVWKGWSCPFFSCRACSWVSQTSAIFNYHYKPVPVPPYSGKFSHPKVPPFGPRKVPDRNTQLMLRKLACAGSLPCEFSSSWFRATWISCQIPGWWELPN